MTHLGYTACSITLCIGLCSCVPDTLQLKDTTDYADFNPIFVGYSGERYSPGFTGYTMGYDGYGDYDDGYGPSWGNPRFFHYSDALQGYGYSKYPHPQP